MMRRGTQQSAYPATSLPADHLSKYMSLGSAHSDQYQSRGEISTDARYTSSQGTWQDGTKTIPAYLQPQQGQSRSDQPPRKRPSGAPVVLNGAKPFVHPISFISPPIELLERSQQAKLLHMQNKALLDRIFGSDSALTIQPAIYATDECIYIQGHTEIKQTIRVEDRGTPKPVYICSCAAALPQALIIEGVADMLVAELSSNLQIVAKDVLNSIVLMGCGNIDLYLGEKPPRVIMVACYDCSVITSKRLFSKDLEMIGCKGITLQLTADMQVAPNQDPALLLDANIEENVLLPDMIRIRLHDGNITTVCDYEPDDDEAVGERRPLTEVQPQVADRYAYIHNHDMYTCTTMYPHP
jgi:hypothetical protein